MESLNMDTELEDLLEKRRSLMAEINKYLNTLKGVDAKIYKKDGSLLHGLEMPEYDGTSAMIQAYSGMKDIKIF